MGDTGHGGGYRDGFVIPDESVTGVGGPVLLARTAPELDRGDLLAARYQIEALIGTGGSGRVLRAFDRVTRELVALKILRPEYAEDPVWTERFSRELRVGRQIQHRNLCRIFDIGEADGHRFLSMELATEGTMRGQIGPPALERPVDERVSDARAIVEGVAALHAAGIVHRDLKPENLLRMEDGRLVVSDFGLATDPGAGPATTIMIGTPRYMAPEVVMGDPATARSDVWALGVVLHEILFGVRPDRSVVCRGVRKYAPPPTASLKERRLAELCGRCTKDDARERPASAAEVLREFEAAVLGRRLRHPASRGQVAWAAVALVALTALGLVRDRWTSRAIASSAATAVSVSSRLLKPRGKPADWGRGSTRLAQFPGRVHCVAVDRDKKRVRVVWGQPRRAENLDIATGATSPTSLLSETYNHGCPQTSPDGRGLLFEKNVEGANQIFLAPDADGHAGHFLTLGSAPVWLPNGQEFVFDIDSRHAAIFSIATHQIAIAGDGRGGPSTLSDKVVDGSGSRVALLYANESLENRIVVRAFPSLDVIASVLVPTWARNLRFSGSNDILFTATGPQGARQLVSADLKTGSLTNVAEIPGADFQMIVGDTGLMTSRTNLRDLWRIDGSTVTQLTSDGKSAAGSMSDTGALVIQRVLADGREVIVYRDEKGQEVQVTDGPFDVTPVFVPGGRKWIFTRLGAGEILECSVESKHCQVVHSDARQPGFAIPDPSAKRIAYVTGLNNFRVSVLSLDTHEQRDLGATLACPPSWATANRLWVVVSEKDNGRTWAELDVDAGRPTGVTRFAADPDRDNDCQPPRDLFPAGGRRVIGKVRTSTAFWLTTHAVH